MRNNNSTEQILLQELRDNILPPKKHKHKWDIIESMLLYSDTITVEDEILLRNALDAKKDIMLFGHQIIGNN